MPPYSSPSPSAVFSIQSINQMILSYHIDIGETPLMYWIGSLFMMTMIAASLPVLRCRCKYQERVRQLAPFIFEEKMTFSRISLNRILETSRKVAAAVATAIPIAVPLHKLASLKNFAVGAVSTPKLATQARTAHSGQDTTALPTGVPTAEAPTSNTSYAMLRKVITEPMIASQLFASSILQFLPMDAVESSVSAHAYTHAYIQAYIRIHTRIHIHTHTHTHIHTRIHTRIHTYIAAITRVITSYNNLEYHMVVD